MRRQRVHGYDWRRMQVEVEVAARVFRDQRRRILATLIRILGDIDLAEESLAVAFEAALAQWPTEGIPDNPRAWLIRIARNKAIDQRRQATLHEAKHAELAAEGDAATAPGVFLGDERTVEDLSLIHI